MTVRLGGSLIIMTLALQLVGATSMAIEDDGAYHELGWNDVKRCLHGGFITTSLTEKLATCFIV
jgi:hypothetical protein